MTRSIWLALGVAVLAALWSGPLAHSVDHSFAAHMTMHMGVVALAAPLIALGTSGHRLDPVRRWPWLFGPIPASFVELAVVWAWHAPALHHFARHTTSGLVLEQGMFFLSAYWVWASSLGGEPALSRDRRGLGVVALLLTSMHMTLLGALLALAPRLLYAHHGSLADQQIGGAIMLGAGAVSYVAGGLGVSMTLLSRAKT